MRLTWNTVVNPVSFLCCIFMSNEQGAPMACARHAGVVAQWCNPLTLQPEHSGGVGSRPGRASTLERHDNDSQIRLD